MYTINHVTTSKGDFYIADNGTASGQGKTPAEAVEDMLRKTRIRKVVQLRKGVSGEFYP